MKKVFLILFLLLTILYFFQLFKVEKNFSQSYRFGDEDAHMAGGYFILKGYKPYKDFYGNHQPMTYILPAIVQKLLPSNSLFLFVSRNRLAIYFYSLIWNVLYLIFFGKFVFFFALIFEITRYVMLGNKVLGEVLAMYPFIFLFGTVIKKSVFNKKISSFEVVIFSLSTFLTVFSLLPLWPSIVILNFLLLISHIKEKNKLFWQLLPFILLTIIIFLFIPLSDYFKATISDNLTLVIPKMNNVSSKLDYLRMILLPLLSTLKNQNFIQITTTIFLFLYLIICLVSKRIKKTLVFSMILLALILSNTRSTVIKFGDFHLLPWLSAFLFIPIIFLGNLDIKKKDRLIGYAYFLSTFLLIGIAIWINLFNKIDFYGRILLKQKNNLADENYINYSKSVKYGLAIKSIKSNGDRLFGMGNDPLAFWVADMDLAVPPLESMRWQYDLTRYNEALYKVFRTNPPEFILLNDLDPLRTRDSVSDFISSQLSNKYINLYHLHKPSELYLLKSKTTKISVKQWNDLKYYLFDKPNISNQIN